MGAEVKNGWWRRNAIALCATALLLPITALIVAGNEWWERNQGRPAFATTAAAGDSIRWADAAWGPASITDETASYAADVPGGAKLVVVRVRVDPQAPGLACSIPVLRELGGGQRQWSSALSDIDWAYELPTSCESEDRAPFVVSVPFLVPDDADGPFGIEFTVVDELPGFLRLEAAL